jgi:cobalt-zinc-cadmium efflux system outer membrane protein
MRQIRRPPLAILLAFAVALPGRLAGQGATAADSLEAALVALALARQPELAARRAAAATAEARLAAAGPRDAPTLGIEAEEIPDGVDLPDAGQALLLLEADLLTGARRAAERVVARTERDAALARLDLAERGLGAAVRRDLAAWRGWLGVAARLGAEDSLLLDAEAGLQARFATGEARYVDVLRLRTERLRVRSERAEALRAAGEGRRALDGLLAPGDSAGPTLQALLRALAELPPPPVTGAAFPPPPDVDSLMLALGALRPGDLAVDRAGAEANRVRASRRARVTGGVGLQRFGDGGGGFDFGPALRATVTLPFAVPGSNRAAYRAADRAVAEARAGRTAFASRLRTTLLVARDRYAAALERLTIYDAALLTGAREEREAALGAFRAGQLSLLELLDFERALARAETDRLRAAMDARVALADLFTAAAGLAARTDAFPDAETGND